MFGFPPSAGARDAGVTTLLYSLEQAARRLDLSETVLLRLSQYFQTPSSAYENVGSLAFTGELLFSEADLSFFSGVRDRIVMGDSLAQIKSQVRRVRVSPNAGSLSPSFNPPPPCDPPEKSPSSSPAQPSASDSSALKTLANQSFTRYRQTHGSASRSNGIFRAMASHLERSPKDADKEPPPATSWVFSAGVVADTLRELFPNKPASQISNPRPNEKDAASLQDAAELGLDACHVYARGRVWPRQEAPTDRVEAVTIGAPRSPLSVQGKAPSLSAVSGPSPLSEPNGALQQAARRLRERALGSV